MKFNKVMYSTNDKYFTVINTFNEVGEVVGHCDYYTVIPISRHKLKIGENIEIEDEYIDNYLKFMGRFYGKINKKLLIFNLGNGYYLYNDKELWNEFYSNKSDIELSIDEYIIKSIIE